MNTRSNYPAGTRWLDYSTSQPPARVPGHARRTPLGSLTVKSVVIGVGAAAAAWGLMHLTLWLLG